MIRDLRIDLDTDSEVASTWQPKTGSDVGKPRMIVAMSSIMSELGISHALLYSPSQFDREKKNTGDYHIEKGKHVQEHTQNNFFGQIPAAGAGEIPHSIGVVV